MKAFLFGAAVCLVLYWAVTKIIPDAMAKLYGTKGIVAEHNEATVSLMQNGDGFHPDTEKALTKLDKANASWNSGGSSSSGNKGTATNTASSSDSMSESSRQAESKASKAFDKSNPDF